MQVICLDLEGVLIPEVWIAFAEKTGIDELKATTRDVPDYDELMQQRLGLLSRHDLKLGEYELCHACRWPVSAAGRSSSNFVAGVSCDHCIDLRTDKQRARYAARQAQVKLAEKHGKLHVGATYETRPR